MEKQNRERGRENMDRLSISLYATLILAVATYTCGLTEAQDLTLQSDLLCGQCSKCDASQCPPSEAYPHMTAWDDTLIAGALQSDFVGINDIGVYSVPSVVGGKSIHNAYYGWESSSGSASGYHRFSNYMDKCSGGSYLSVDEHGVVALRSLNSLKSLAQAEWKSYNAPPGENHREFRFWMSRSSGKCLTVFGGKNRNKRVVGVSECRMNGSNPYQLFAFRFHYHKAFCCCGKYNE